MNHSATTIGPGHRHFARTRLRRARRRAVHGGALALAFGCAFACGADTRSSENAAGTTTEPASATVPSSSSNASTTAMSTTGAPTSSTGPASSSSTSSNVTSSAEPTAESEPAADTSEAALPGGTSSAGELTSEAETSMPSPNDPAPPGGTSAGCGKTPTLKSGSATIDVNGSVREYILNLPSDYDSSKPYKLIFGLHWRGGQASDVATGGTVGLGNYYGLEDIADGSAIFVAPNGLDNGWANTGGRDIAFIKAILAAFQDDLCIDIDRIFSVGFSYGGMMSFAIACEMGDVFRAIAPLSGALYSGCGNGNAPIAMWGSHGTSDDVVPIDDGRAGLQEVLERNHCSTETTATSPDNCVTYTGCDEGYPVTWCEFDGGHSPQRWQTQPIWEFFSQF